MRRVKLTAFLALILLMSLSAVKSLCAETPWGRVPVYGYKDTIRKDNRKFAPYAILVEERNVTGLYLEYTYSRYNMEGPHGGQARQSHAQSRQPAHHLPVPQHLVG